jgi:hypothetical protein
MLIYQENYGEDIDGNRGTLIWQYELEDEDFFEVQDKVLSYLWENGYTFERAPDIIEVPMYDYINDEVVHLEVNPRDYI